jgi:aspartate kinase
MGVLAEICSRHNAIASELLSQDRRMNFDEYLQQDFEAIGRVIRRISADRKASDCRSDAVVSFGERWSSKLLHSALVEGGHPAVLVDSKEFMITDEEFTNATPMFDLLVPKCREILLPHLALAKIVVTQGFVGISQHGRTTTIGRGGSDYSASIIGAALGAREIEIWTDTDGILSADPRIVPDALAIKEISVEEATELAHYGAKVIHPSTLAPAMESGIPVRILNSRNPEHSGTVVRAGDEVAARENFGVKSVTGRKGVCSIALRKDKRLNTVHFVHHVFDVLEKYRKGVEFVSCSETGVFLVTSDDRNNQSLLSELRHHDGAEIYEGEAIVSVVGTYEPGEPPIQSKVHEILTAGGLAVHLSYEGISKHSTAFVIDGSRLEEAVRLLHGELVSVATESRNKEFGSWQLHHASKVAASPM